MYKIIQWVNHDNTPGEEKHVKTWYSWSHFEIFTQLNVEFYIFAKHLKYLHSNIFLMNQIISYELNHKPYFIIV